MENVLVSVIIKEEMEILRCFWPPFAAELVSKAYANAQKSNTVIQKETGREYEQNRQRILPT